MFPGMFPVQNPFDLLPTFQPMYIFPWELQSFGLPTPDAVSEITGLVQLASSLIDEACGRLDGDGNGSLVYTTYTQRVLLQTRNRNLCQIPVKPISVVPSGTMMELQLLQSASGNCFYTGVQANTAYSQLTGQLTGLVAASGRYGYTRQDQSIAYPDLFAFINPLNLVTMFGGPAPWVSIDITQTDYDPKTGEMWPPAGLQLQRYSEIIVTYNSGWDPRQMPWAIKFVTASIVKNAMVGGNATTALRSLTLGRAGAGATFFQQGLIDPTLDVMLAPFKAVRAY
jgi:hypothetical protein